MSVGMVMLELPIICLLKGLWCVGAATTAAIVLSKVNTAENLMAARVLASVRLANATKLNEYVRGEKGKKRWEFVSKGPSVDVCIYVRPSESFHSRMLSPTC